MKILFLGDTHGSVPAFNLAIRACEELELDVIFQVGDFGYWPRSNENSWVIKSISRTAQEAGIKVYWIPGNHEDWEMYLAKIVTGNKDEHGFTPIDKGGVVLAAPPTHVWSWDDLKFGSVGGAYSIDRKFRTKGRSWFDEEVPQWYYPNTFAAGDFDIMVSHDAPINIADRLGWHPVQINEPDLSAQSNAVVSLCYDYAKASLAIHGHWHWSGRYLHNYTEVVGLDAADQSPLQRSSVILDTEMRHCYTFSNYNYQGEPFWQR